ncbi:MAG TPA: MFS transporter [Candidatus Choladousia intestinigallinarum]|nr:MFS transporter [Candidatus Choladousia intestinigallinarum]
MSKIRKQIFLLYMISILESFKLAGASWVALLAARGFSMLEIGAAESIFHVASLLFEVPSGVISDVFGRKRSMVMCHCMFALSAVTMILADSFPGIGAAMVLNAFAYNFASGTREALAYDSLKQEGREEEYVSFSSWEMMIYRLGAAGATLLVGLALWMGWRKAYTLDGGISLVCVGLALGLWEPAFGQKKTEKQGLRGIFRETVSCFQESFAFMGRNPRAMGLMIWNALIGACATLTLYFLQARLTDAGLEYKNLGLALFFMTLGGAAGAKAVPLFHSWRYKKLSLLCLGGVALGFAASTGEQPLLMILGGFAGAFFDDLIQVRTDVLLNGMVPSGQRATLLSISSLCFSGVMIFLALLFGGIYG